LFIQDPEVVREGKAEIQALSEAVGIPSVSLRRIQPSVHGEKGQEICSNVIFFQQVFYILKKRNNERKKREIFG